MNYGFVIAEKKSVSDDIKYAYEQAKGKYSFSLDFGSAAGHLLKLVEPDNYKASWGKPWNKDVLPMFPDTWRTEVVRKDYYKAIKDAVQSGKYDFLVNACDCGREGEHIFYTIYEKVAEETGISLPVKRMWFDDQTIGEIQRSISDLRDESEFVGYRISSDMRARLDWLIGMNFTRMACLCSGTPIIVGRCISVLLSMVAKREYEIMNFIPVPYYEYKAVFLTDKGEEYSGLLVNEDNEDNKHRFLNKADIEALSFSGAYSVKDVVKKDKKNQPKQLMNLSELQKECSRALGLTANKTLQIAEELYMKKLISYPRTEYRYLTDGVTTKFVSILNAIKGISEYKGFAETILNNPKMYYDVAINKRYVDNKKVGDHHAIIPTEKPLDVTLNKEEQGVYDIIIRRFLSIFYPSCVMSNTTITTVCDNGLTFISTGSVMKEMGWKEICGNDSKDEILPDVNTSDSVSLKDGEILEKETKAPPRYNDATILTCMETAGKDVDDDELKKVLEETAGIGTPATRAGIIENCIKYKWIERKKKGKMSVFIPTDYGLKLYDLLKDHDFMSPTLTAEWEKRLLEIEKNNGDTNNIYSDIVDYISQGCKRLSDELKKVEWSKPIQSSVGRCPDCGNEVIKGKQSYFCKGYLKKNEDGTPSCSFAFRTSIAGANITEIEANKLLTEKKTSILKFKSKTKTGSTYTNSLMLKLNTETNRHEVVFSPFEEQSVGACPICGSRVITGQKVYFCEKCREIGENQERLCKFSFFKNVGGANITPRIAEELLTNKETSTEILLNSPKFGKYKRKLQLRQDDNGNYIVAPEIKEKSIIGKCPVCGRTLFEGDNSYYCAGKTERDKNDEPVCTFMAPKTFKDIEILPKDIEELVNTGVIKNKKTGDSEYVSFELGKDYYGNDSIVCIAGKCPVCEKKIRLTNAGYFCETKGCTRIFLPDKGLGIENISIRDARTLFLGQSLADVPYKTKRGKSGKATIILKDGKLEVEKWQ